MAETILYRNFRKFADYSKKNQSKTLNNLRDMNFPRLELSVLKTEMKIQKKTGAIGPTGGAISNYQTLGQNLTMRTRAFIFL